MELEQEIAMQDEVISHTEIRFGWMERLRILCGRPAYMSVFIKTEHMVGAVQGRWDCHVARIIPPSSPGAATDVRLVTEGRTESA